MHGLHLTGDLSGCRCEPALLTDVAVLEAACVDAVKAAGLVQVNRLFHVFAAGTDAFAAGAEAVAADLDALPAAPDGLAPSSGITGVVLLAESHLAVHTWPELASVTLDVYVCNYGGDNSAKAQRLFDGLIALFSPAQVQRNKLTRG